MIKKILNSLNSKDKDPSFLSESSVKNANRLIIGNLNINSIFNRFNQLKARIESKVDIIAVTETKLDSTFPTSQLYVNGFTRPIRLDGNRNGEGVPIYIRRDIPSKELENHLPNDIQGMFIKLNLRKTKWLLFGCYQPPSQSDNNFFYHIKNNLDKLSQKYNKYMLVGDFNAEDSETCLSNFLFEINAENIITNYTCYKSVEKASCIDLVITNSPLTFQN